MTEPVRPPGRPRNPAVRAAILRAAAALLDEGGLTAVTMEGIARRAGVGKPTIYRHWPNAAAVAMAAFLETATQPETMATAGSALADLRQQLAAVAGAFAARTGRNVKAMIAASEGETELARRFAPTSLPPAAKPHAACSSAQWQRRAAPWPRPRDHLDLIYGPIYYRLLVGHASLDRGFTDALLGQAMAGLAAKG